MIIMKFGGSSVANAERILEVKKIVEKYLDKKPVLVFSACFQTTDWLIEAGNNALNGNVDASKIVDFHNNLLKDLKLDGAKIKPLLDEIEDLLKSISLFKEFTSRIKDKLMSYGERLSVRIISDYFNAKGIKAKAFDAWDIGFLTDANYGNAQIDVATYDNINKKLGYLKENYEYTPIITGFIAKDKTGTITTLGRSGSDFSASILGAALLVDEIQVWKDVDGILTADPRIVKEPKVISSLSFNEASELAYFGAKVLHPASIVPAMQRNIPVRVKNSYNIDAKGSVVLSEELVKKSDSSKGTIKAITAKRKIILIDIVSTRMLGQSGFLSKVFNIFEQENISVDMISSSEISISLTIDNRYDVQKLSELLSEYANINVSYNKSIITLISDAKDTSLILGKAFSLLASKSYNVQMISHGASKVNISFILEDSEIEDAVRLLHKEFFENAV
ncbi:MAG: aspartate kinase [Bdellovibrionota bacterium]